MRVQRQLVSLENLVSQWKFYLSSQGPLRKQQDALLHYLTSFWLRDPGEASQIIAHRVGPALSSLLCLHLWVSEER